MFQKNVSGQHWTIEAFDAATGLQKTGDAANITIYYQQGNLSSALGAVTAMADVSINESSSTNSKGTYWGNLSQGESNCDEIVISGKSSTGNITVPSRRYNTVAPNMNKFSVDANGRGDVIKIAGTTQTAGDLVTLITAVDDFLDTEVAAIKAKTDNLPTDPADQSLIIAATNALVALIGMPAGASIAADIATRLASAGYTAPPTAVENADALLDRNMATGVDNSSDTNRTVRSALRQVRNKFSISGVTITYTKENDTTTSHTGTLTTDAAAVPIIGYDPAGP